MLDHTDNYGFETSFRIYRPSDGRVFVWGPTNGRRYGKRQRYVRRACLPPEKYVLEMRDLMGDGLCCDYGPGRATVRVDGAIVVRTGSESFKVKQYDFVVAWRAEPPEIDVPTKPQPDAAINWGRECAVRTPIDYNAKCEFSFPLSRRG